MNKNVDINSLRDRVRGSIVGGAIGDAWGYPVEFISYEEITTHYGSRGITRLELDPLVGKAVVSDDTQMTLFTAMGLINAHESQVDCLSCIADAYIEWFYTQMWSRSLKSPRCFIAALPELQVSRAPGSTCMSALYDILQGRPVLNHSKGCGGVMRVAPVPLYFLAHTVFNSIDDVDVLAADAARITHKHPMGYIPAAFVSHLIYCLAADEQPSTSGFVTYVTDAMAALYRLYPDNADMIADFSDMIKSAIDMALSETELSDNEAIDSIGEGWVADEAAAIACYCVCKYFDDFEQALIAAANHDGDSDSTAAIAGNILGAAMGYNAIPEYLKRDVEMHSLAIKIADALVDGCISG